MANVIVYSHNNFDEYCHINNVTDNNVEDEHNNKAFISIINTRGNMKVLDGREDKEHWFKEKHPNVLNLMFDDTPRDIFYKGLWWYTMNQEQADETVKFIENNLGKDFIIHCLAGQSRSQAIAHFIVNKYKSIYAEITNRTETPNQGVLKVLNEAFNRIHGIDLQKEYEALFNSIKGKQN